jgi:putative MATE family efflux protein
MTVFQRPSSPANHVSHVTTGPIRRTLLTLALPVLGEQVLNSFISLFDTYLAGRFGAAATSAVGLAAYVSWLAQMLVMLVGTGTTALVARHIGAGRSHEANGFANQSLTLAAMLGVGMFAALYALAPAFARYLNMTPEGAGIAVQYLRIDASGYLLASVTLVGCAALRGVGDMRTPMLIFLAINVCNVLASCALVFGFGPLPSLGVTGIVAGTVTARALGAGLILVIFTVGRRGLRLYRRELRPRWQLSRRILRIGVPAAADGAVMWCGHFVMLAVISRLADPVRSQAYFAAHVIAVRTEALTYLPAVAWAAATATMIGQALGAGDPRRARRVGHEAVLQCGTLALGVAFFFFLGARFIYEQMSVDPLVRDSGIGPFRILAFFQPCLVLSIVYIGGLRGAGDTRFPLLITVIGTIIRIGLASFGGLILNGGLIGAWLGMLGDMTWRALASSLRFYRAKWVHTQV